MDINSNLFNGLSDEEKDQVTAIFQRRLPKVLEDAVQEAKSQSENGQASLRQQFLEDLKGIRPGDNFRLSNLMAEYRAKGLQNVMPG